MIMKQGFVRGAVSGSLLGLLAGVAVMTAQTGLEDIAMKIKNFDFAPQHATVKAGTTATGTNAGGPHTIASTTKPFRSKVLDTEYDTGVICDTQKQAERLAMLLEDNERAVIATVNAEARDPSACAVQTVAFVRGARLATARSRVDTFAVVEILVVGADLGSGFQMIAPGAHFMLVKIDERGA
jgi:plastocyanin